MSMQHANLTAMRVDLSEPIEIAAAKRISGRIVIPGDKSISHRLAMIGSIAEGSTIIRNFSPSVDCTSTLECLRRTGVSVDRSPDVIQISGPFGSDAGRFKQVFLDAGNSGTTVRLMSGLLAARRLEATFTGDESLSRRPMKRIIEPLRRFGARLEARDDSFLPLTIRGSELNAIEYTLPIASAQIKSAILLAGVQAHGTTRVRELIGSRNHTEIALREFGAQIQVTDGTIEVDGRTPLRARRVTVPGDLSSAAFFVAAAVVVPNSSLRISGVGLNPTRSGFIDLLKMMGAKIHTVGPSMGAGEPIGDIVAESSELEGMEVPGRWIPNIIDEIPVLAVLAVRTKHGVHIREARELRTKESDRIESIVVNLRKLGVAVEEYEDGFFVPGNQRLLGGSVDSFGDHRIAMAFAVAGLIAKGPVTIHNPSCVAISFPNFFELLQSVNAA
jgi:3-phosphoshikimate 1-carboxyvinyltransferase